MPNTNDYSIVLKTVNDAGTTTELTLTGNGAVSLEANALEAIQILVRTLSTEGVNYTVPALTTLVDPSAVAGVFSTAVSETQLEELLKNTASSDTPVETALSNVTDITLGTPALTGNGSTLILEVIPRLSSIFNRAITAASSTSVDSGLCASEAGFGRFQNCADFCKAFITVTVY